MGEKLLVNDSDGESEEASDDSEPEGRDFRLPVGLAVTLSLAVAVGAVWGLAHAHGSFGFGVQGGKARVHVLMMGMDIIPHTEIWKAFFHGAPRESYSFLIHCKDEARCRDLVDTSGLSDFAEVVPSAYSAWCDDLVSPMLQLLKYALAKEPSPGYPVDKFAFVSTEHLPMKPLRVISETLGKRPDESDICVHPTRWWLHLKANKTTPVAVTCYQWSVFSRRDAITLTERMPDPSPSKQLAVPAVEGYAFQDFDTVHCIDESWIFATIFGLAHVPQDPNTTAHLNFPGFGRMWYPSEWLQGRCPYFGFEGYPGEIWYHAYTLNETEAGAALALQRITDSSFISPPTHCDTTGWCEVIWVINSLGPKGLEFVRNSEFLFGRKFAAAGLFPDYASVVFS